MNDSIDAMKKEFNRQYKDLMLDSNASKALAISPKGQPKTAVDPQLQMELERLRSENEYLTKVIEDMKTEMERVVQQVHEAKNSSPDQLKLQEELIRKERKIYELERKLRHKEDEIGKLKQERDRLVQISNDLRGELSA